MFSYITGTIEHIGESSLIIECGGIGYLLHVSSATAAKVAHKAFEKIHTIYSVREDGVFLYGFSTEEERDIFELLTSVSGVGPKAALSLLSALTPSRIILAIVTDDADALSRAQGIGKKTAQRISMELRDKVKGYDAVADIAGQTQEAIPSRGLASSGAKQDAVEALIALGYGRSESVKAVLEIAVAEMDAEQIIKAALRKLV